MRKRSLSIVEKLKRKGLEFAYEYGRGSGGNKNPLTYDQHQNYRLMEFMESGNIAEVLDLIKSWYVDVNAYSTLLGPIHLVCLTANHHLLEVLLAAGANPNRLYLPREEPIHPLSILINRASVERSEVLICIDTLLNAGADPDLLIENTDFYQMIRIYEKLNKIESKSDFLNSPISRACQTLN